MNLLICAPGVRFEEVLTAARDAGLIYLTEPLDQRAPAEKAGLKARLLEDDDFCSTNEEHENLVRRAKEWARNWHRQGALHSLAYHRGVHASELVMQSFTIEVLALFKPAHLYGKLLEKYPVKRIYIAGEGPWKEAALFIARRHGIPVEILALPARAIRSEKNNCAARMVTSGLNRLIKKPSKGFVLYSSAPRYAMPLLERSGGYYLRDTFSIDMFLRSLREDFSLILPEYFPDHGSSAARLSKAEELFAATDGHFSKDPFFEWQGVDLWPLFRGSLQRLLRTEMTEGMRLTERFYAMFRTLEPRALFVDEEVCLFNKTLVHTANALGIPTLVFVHGEPYDDIGNLPSSASRVLAWGPSTARRLVEWGIPPAKIEQVGAPQFTFSNAVRERTAVSRRFNIPSGAPLALFGAFPFSTNEHATFLRTSYGVKLQEKSLDAALRALERHPRLHLIVKFHPYENHSGFSRARADAAPEGVRSRVRFVYDYPAAKLIAAADTVWTVLSTMYAETLPWKKPALAFTDATYPHPASGLQWSVDIEDPSACDEAVDACLDPSNVAKIRSRIEEEVSDYFINGNRTAVERALDAIERMPAQGGAAIPPPDAGPLISVIMGVYNGEAYLAEQINSVLAQTHANLEIVVFDDGSRDGSVALAESFTARDRRVRVVRNAGNKGLVTNFLEGLGAAAGEFVAFSDQDDVWRPDKLETLLRVINVDSRNMLAFSDMEVCDESMRPIARSFWKAAGIRPKAGRLAERSVLRNLAPGCSMLFRRETKEAVWELVRRVDFKVLNAAGILDNTPFMHDHLAFVAATALGRIAYTPEPLLRYRQHGANNIGAFYKPDSRKLRRADILKHQIEILETTEWARRGLDLKRLRRYHAALDKGSVFGKLAILSDYLYLHA